MAEKEIPETSGLEHDINAPERTSTREHTRSRRMGGLALRYGGVAVIGMMAALGANNLYGNHTSVGPLDVTTRITVGAPAVGMTSDFIDLRQDRDSKLPIGAYADVNGTTNTAMSAEDLVKSAAVVGDPKAIGEQLVSDYVHQAELAAALGGAAGMGVFGLLEWGGLDKKRRRWVYSGLAAGALIVNAGAGYVPTRDINDIPWQSTSFAVGGHAVNVEYAGSAGGEIATMVANNETYYTKIRDNTKEALLPVAAEDAKLRPNDARVNVYSDWHCNYGMARVIRQVNDSLAIKDTLNVGDNFLGQTSIETLCADVLATNLKTTTNYVAPGNHDANFLLDQMKKDGFKILEGKPVNVAGATVLGFADPDLSPAYSHEDTLRDPAVTKDDFEATVTEKTCEVAPDILLVHEPVETSDEARNCADVTFNGHTHVKKKPYYTGPNSVSMNDGTAGGAAPNRQSVGGTLGKDATMYVLYINKDGQPVGARLVTAHPDTSVNVSKFMSLTDFPVKPAGHPAPMPVIADQK